MKFQNNGGHRNLTGHNFSPNKASSSRIGLHLLEFLTKNSPIGIPKQHRILSRK